MSPAETVNYMLIYIDIIIHLYIHTYTFIYIYFRIPHHDINTVGDWERFTTLEKRLGYRLQRTGFTQVVTEKMRSAEKRRKSDQETETLRLEREAQQAEVAERAGS